MGWLVGGWVSGWELLCVRDLCTWCHLNWTVSTSCHVVMYNKQIWYDGYVFSFFCAKFPNVSKVAIQIIFPSGNGCCVQFSVLVQTRVMPLIEFLNNRRFWLFKSCSIREVLVWFLWKKNKNRIKEPSVQAISKALKNRMVFWLVIWFFPNNLRTVVIYQNQVFDFWESWLWILRVALINCWVLLLFLITAQTLVTTLTWYTERWNWVKPIQKRNSEKTAKDAHELASLEVIIQTL